MSTRWFAGIFLTLAAEPQPFRYGLYAINDLLQFGVNLFCDLRQTRIIDGLHGCNRVHSGYLNAVGPLLYNHVAG
jgi:hypothetical protein